jgi:2-methylcitrate dehydratase PrpD
MAKPLAVGIAARNGVLAAQLAAAGFKAEPPDLPPPTEIFAVRLKPYPCGGLTHTAIYAAMELRRENGITPEDIARVEVRIPQYTADTLGSKTPETGLQGKFSIRYLVARALMDGNVTLASFADDAVRDPRVRELMRKIAVGVDPEMVSSNSPEGSRPASVAITLNGGQMHRRFEQYPKGSPHVPMSYEELLEKVRACGLAEEAIALIDRLEMLPDIRPLAQALLKR